MLAGTLVLAGLLVLGDALPLDPGAGLVPRRESKPGVCPDEAKEAANCTESCQDDGNCNGNLKCCLTACGMACQMPNVQHGLPLHQQLQVLHQRLRQNVLHDAGLLRCCLDLPASAPVKESCSAMPLPARGPRVPSRPLALAAPSARPGHSLKPCARLPIKQPLPQP
ncbi:hypothetical protein Y1Q_0008900 [Alligator mississippiensis]|uniref:WAP domain-containing protein n=1 Tax=Alligator mississippiensis TaxID=8496 RepID=A0A151MIM6_ALLMI|nr:hypothetical protein Y1Q_0008900 [Alligator mississippiensis]